MDLDESEESTPLISASARAKLKRLRWRSILIAYVITLTCCMQTPVYSSSLYQFLYALDEKTTSAFYGNAVLSFYVASAVSSLVYGLLSNVLRQTKIFILNALFFTALGSILLFVAPTFAADQRVVILVARILCGLGFGILGVVSAFVIMESQDDERRFAVSSKCAVTSIAAIFGPLILLAFYLTGDAFDGRNIVVNMFTGPPLLFATICVVEFLVVLRWFSESWVAVERIEHRKVLMERKESAFAPLPKFDKVSVSILIILHGLFELLKNYMDSIQSPSTMAMFGWTSKDAVLYNGAISLAAAAIAVVGNIMDGNLIMRFLPERQIMLLCLISIAIFYGVSFPSRRFATTSASCTYDWCATGRTTTLTAYLIGYFFFAVGYGFSVVPNCILFSRVLGPRKQGTMQGVYNSVAEFVLIVSPVGNVLLTNWGPPVVWICGLAVTFAAFFVLLAAYTRLVPFRY